MTKSFIKFKLIKVRNILGIDFYTGSISLNDIKEIGEVPVYRNGTYKTDIKEMKTKTYR